MAAARARGDEGEVRRDRQSRPAQPGLTAPVPGNWLAPLSRFNSFPWLTSAAPAAQLAS